VSRLPSLGPRGEGWVAIQIALLGAIGAAGLFAGGGRGPLSWVATLIGAIVLVAGMVLAARALLDLGPALTAMPRPRPGSSLVQSGAYRHARHPIYGGVILMAFGWAMVMASPPAIVLSVILLVFFELKAKREEAWLLQHDEGYADYRARTRRFIPWIL
jgi:protein-S-isoprenylcysteine O-methyltransferase Ste14